ncbi:MAG: hypothetical protein IJW17_13205 [Lentisphaeria bacterium]|nr:hypothetical protein [Lentisphaeria bacterium]
MSLKYPTTSKTLLDKIASGDEISWDEFYQKYSPIVKAIAKFKGLDANAVDDLWADPRGEFLSLRAADDCFRLLGKGGIGKAEFPLPEQPLFADGIGYYRRRGVHDVPPVDWEFVLQFINKNS